MKGLGLSPKAPTTISAINAPAPVSFIADANGSIPENKKIVVQSIAL